MGRAFKIFLAFIAGLIVGEAIPIVWYIVATNYLGHFDRDGGGAMGAIFIMGPILALIVGTVAAIVTARRTARA
jgi:F0F1-type ATP synthase assembly protein I